MTDRKNLIEQLLNDGYVPRAMLQDHGVMVEMPDSQRRVFAGRLADYILEREQAARVDENEYWLQNRTLLEKAGETGNALLVDSLQLKGRIYTLNNQGGVLAALTPKTTEQKEDV